MNPGLRQRPQNVKIAPAQAAKTIAAVGLGPLGLSGGAFSGSAAVVWNLANIVATDRGQSPGGLAKKGG